MGGVVIGSTMELVSRGQQWLALMINTACNSNCPICYLGEKTPNQTIKLEMAMQLAKIVRDGVAIIGTEPLLDERSVEIINIFAPNVKTHIITNGVNLEKFSDRIVSVKRVDVSLHGGPQTYPRSGSSFAAIQRGVNKWKDLSGGDVCIVNTLYRENISNIEDMLEGSRLLGVKQTFFSPFVKTLGGYSKV